MLRNDSEVKERRLSWVPSQYSLCTGLFYTWNLEKKRKTNSDEKKDFERQEIPEEIKTAEIQGLRNNY